MDSERETHTGVIGVVYLDPLPEGVEPSSIIMARPEVARAMTGIADLPDPATLRARYGLVVTEQAPTDGFWMFHEQAGQAKPLPEGWTDVGYIREDG